MCLWRLPTGAGSARARGGAGDDRKRERSQSLKDVWVYELYDQQQALPENVHLLVRGQQDRCLKDGSRLIPSLSQAPRSGPFQVAVPRRPGQPARRATLELRFKEVALKPPAVALKKSWQIPLESPMNDPPGEYSHGHDRRVLGSRAGWPSRSADPCRGFTRIAGSGLVQKGRQPYRSKVSRPTWSNLAGPPVTPRWEALSKKQQKRRCSAARFMGKDEGKDRGRAAHQPVVPSSRRT